MTVKELRIIPVDQIYFSKSKIDKFSTTFGIPELVKMGNMGKGN
jgi:hypothetical protein